MTNLVSHLREVVRDDPEGTALSVAGTETTYSQLWAMTGRFAAGLVERGVEPGDPIALYLPNLPQFVAAFHGALRAGGIVVPMNPQYKAREIRHLLTDSAAGAVVTTTDRVSEIEAVHADTEVRFIVTADGEDDFSTGFADFLDTDASFDFWELAERDDDEVAVQPYTSGTTGDPKGVELTHGNLASNVGTAADLVPGGVGPDDGTLGALPLYHIYGLTVVMNATLLNGGTFYPMAEWDAGRAFRLIEEEDVDILHGVPAMYNDLLHHPEADEYDLSSVRLAGVGGSAIPVEVLRQFEERFDVTIYEGYGLTETSPVTHFNAPEWGRRVGSIGKPLPDVEARVVDDDFEAVPPVEEGPVDEADVDLEEMTGELVVAGPNVMKGYHDLPEANDASFTEADGSLAGSASGTSSRVERGSESPSDRASGPEASERTERSDGERWFHTGDVAYHDEDGYFFVVDRKKDVVVTAGYNVYPREVEELLYEHEAVADAAVVGTPDERRGETVEAYIVPGADAEVTAEGIRDYCLDNLAEYKHPREVEFVDELPRTNTGKVQKYKLREESSAPEGGAEAGTDGEASTVEGDAGAGTGAAVQDGLPEDIEEISGVGPTKGETLREAGFESVEDVRTASQEDLAEVEGIGAALAERIKADVEDTA